MFHRRYIASFSLVMLVFGGANRFSRVSTYHSFKKLPSHHSEFQGPVASRGPRNHQFLGPPDVPPPGIKPLIDHWFPFSKALLNPYFTGGKLGVG